MLIRCHAAKSRHTTIDFRSNVFQLFHSTCYLPMFSYEKTEYQNTMTRGVQGCAKGGLEGAIAPRRNMPALPSEGEKLFFGEFWQS